MSLCEHDSTSEMAEECRRHIILVGFMGAGKSSVARRIARWEHLSCIDSDSYIERQEDICIVDFFREHGEPAFRELETAFLHTMFTRERSVLSCGGGIVTSAASRAVLPLLGTVIFLRVSPEQVLQRISNPKTRPLLSGAVSPAELMARREELYADTASFTVETDGRSVNQVAHEVIRRLRAKGEL